MFWLFFWRAKKVWDKLFFFLKCPILPYRWLASYAESSLVTRSDKWIKVLLWQICKKCKEIPPCVNLRKPTIATSDFNNRRFLNLLNVFSVKPRILHHINICIYTAFTSTTNSKIDAFMSFLWPQGTQKQWSLSVCPN